MSRSYAIVGPNTFAGVRVDGFTTYTPAHITQAGKRNSAQCTLNCYANLRARKGQAEGKRMRFKFSAWGKLADATAFIAHKGMALDIVAVPEAYKSRVWITNAQGQRVPQLDAAGVEIKTWDVGYKIIDIQFAEEAAEFIKSEIMAGRRPQFWNVDGHQHYASWLAILQQRKNTPRPPYQAGMQQYGFAKVFIPQGVTLDFSDPNAPQPYNQQQGNMQSMVDHATRSYPGNGGAGGYVDPNAALNGGGQPNGAVPPVNPMQGQQQQQAPHDPYSHSSYGV